MRRPDGAVLVLSIALGTFVALADPMPAQAPAAVRVPQTGRVLDKDKKPVADAKVTLVSAGSHGGLDEGDVVRVDADAEGRFRAQLQPTRSYVAWTTTPCEDGVAASWPVDVGTLPTELTAATQEAATRFQVTGLEAWRELGPLRVEIAVFDCPALAIRGELDDAGAIEVPPLPGVNCAVRVFAKDALVHATWFPLHAQLPLPAPQRLAVRVADDKGQPVAKATVQRVVSRWYPGSGPFPSRPDVLAVAVATTGDDGTAQVLLARDKPLFESGGEFLSFRAVHDGHATGVSGFTAQAFANDELVAAKEANGVLPFVLAPSRATPVKLLAPDGHLPAAVQVVGHRDAPHGKSSSTSLVDGELVPVRDGVLRFEKGARGIAFESGMGAIELPSQEPPLPPGDPWQRSARPRPLVVSAAALDAGELDLRQVLPLRIQVLDAGAGPAIGAYVLCSPEARGAFVTPALAMHARCDRSGRIVLPVLLGKWFVMATLGDGVAHAIVTVAPGLAAQTLQLHAFDRMRVHVVDGDGKPVDRVSFGPTGSDWQAGGAAEDEMLRQLSWQLSSWAMQRTRTDADGNADIPFLAWPLGQLRIQAVKNRLSKSDIRLVAGEERVEVVLK